MTSQLPFSEVVKVRFRDLDAQGISILPTT